ncbi:hypothetical protein M427DRAFT_289293 [Gonapodya prolifera JEL478]|uniref:HMG box domain-containing protein n=1 Tax=Gonapodya prolifera (strain JEL478) TaxID=1344416 RepID=A0A139AIS7_GONPJ|nr:hypothetical protein M427DRAFT_289293 [Gonapodya prolifera JEL478]|eukprot:KXS16711.1 hypothetical protein M427DRAFT_289293 [Gonapodya prolifera JEL478]
MDKAGDGLDNDLSDTPSTVEPNKPSPVPKGLPKRRGRPPKTSTTLISALPMSAPAPFVLFTREKRPEVKAAFPDLSFATIPATIGNMWKALSNEEKQNTS